MIFRSEKAQLKFGKAFDYDGCLNLACPWCGEDYLHQGDVEVFYRPRGEDGMSVGVLVQEHGKLAINADTAHNPSERRQGLRISFLCETCGQEGEKFGEEFWLEIFQHKGQTFVRWVREL